QEGWRRSQNSSEPDRQSQQLNLASSRHQDRAKTYANSLVRGPIRTIHADQPAFSEYSKAIILSRFNRTACGDAARHVYSFTFFRKQALSNDCQSKRVRNCALSRTFSERRRRKLFPSQRRTLVLVPGHRHLPRSS